jgi:hypothetical protein
MLPSFTHSICKLSTVIDKTSPRKFKISQSQTEIEFGISENSTF